MGDRCTVYFNEFDARSGAKIVEHFGPPEESYDDGQWDQQLVYYEMNYAGTDDLCDIAKSDPSFVVVGSHTAGDSYDPMSFVVLDRHYHEWEVNGSVEYVLANRREDEIDQEDIEEQVEGLRKFLALRAEAVARVRKAKEVTIDGEDARR